MINFPNVFIRIVIPQCGWNRIFEIKPDSPDYRDFKNKSARVKAENKKALRMRTPQKRGF